jgi:hypothetical protein
MNGYFGARMDHPYGVFKAGASEDTLTRLHSAARNHLEVSSDSRIVRPKHQETLTEPPLRDN